jgi:hypothetical protein
MFIISGCAKSFRSKLVGQWTICDKYGEMDDAGKDITVLEFRKDGDVIFNEFLNGIFSCYELFERGRYEIENDSLLIFNYECKIQYYNFRENEYTYENERSSKKFRILTLDNEKLILSGEDDYYNNKYLDDDDNLLFNKKVVNE